MRSFTIATIATMLTTGSAVAQVYNPYSGYGPGPGYPYAHSQSYGGPEDAGMTELQQRPRQQPQQQQQVPGGCVERTICVENSCKRARICP